MYLETASPCSIHWVKYIQALWKMSVSKYLNLPSWQPLPFLCRFGSVRVSSDDYVSPLEVLSEFLPKAAKTPKSDSRTCSPRQSSWFIGSSGMFSWKTWKHPTCSRFSDKSCHYKLPRSKHFWETCPLYCGLEAFNKCLGFHHHSANKSRCIRKYFKKWKLLPRALITFLQTHLIEHVVERSGKLKDSGWSGIKTSWPLIQSKAILLMKHLLGLLTRKDWSRFWTSIRYHYLWTVRTEDDGIWICVSTQPPIYDLTPLEATIDTREEERRYHNVIIILLHPTMTSAGQEFQRTQESAQTTNPKTPAVSKEWVPTRKIGQHVMMRKQSTMIPRPGGLTRRDLVFLKHCFPIR